MLEANKIYRDNDGRNISIGGRIKKYSAEFPYVWSIGGNWYDEQTGAFVSLARAGRNEQGDLLYEYKLLPVENWRSIQNHTEIPEETEADES